MYGISINTPDGSEAAFGEYTMVETNGNISAVELYVNLLGNNYLIATLTNIVIIETANELNATFDVVFNIPEDYEWSCGSYLSGTYTAEKEESLAGAAEATPDSNFAKLVNTWLVVSVYQIENNERVDITANANEVCEYDEEEYCEQDSMQITFSAYGTYLVINYWSNGEMADWDEGEWEFANCDQTEITLTAEDEYDGDEYEERLSTMTINTLNDTEFSGSLSETEDTDNGSETYVSEFILIKVTN